VAKKIVALMIISLMFASVPSHLVQADAPSIELQPKEISIIVKQGETGTASLGIFNRGDSQLMFALSKSYSKPQNSSNLSANGQLLVYPTYLDFGTVPTKGNLSQNITCTAPGETYLQVLCASDTDWIKCSTRNIESTIVSVTVTVTLDGLVTGQLYRGNVILSSNAGVVTIPVILQVATSNVVDWLTYTPTNGMVAPGQNILATLTAEPRGLPPGDHFATIIVTSNDQKTPVQSVIVKLTVVAGSPPPLPVETFVGYPGNKKAHMFWSPSKSQNVAGYYIYRATSPGGYTNIPITDFFVSATNYSDPNTENAITYYYIIKTVDVNGVMSDPSVEIMVTPNPVPTLINLKNGMTTRSQVIEITGQVESNSQVIVSGEMALVNPDGKFSIKTMLKNGANTITIFTLDPDGNQQKYIYKVYFSIYTTIIIMIGSKDATINGEVVKNAMSSPPAIITGKTIVPFRFIGEKLGAEIGWDETTKKVSYKLEGKTIEMWIGKSVTTVNGLSVKVDPPPQVVKGATMVPLRFISDNLGAGTEWRATTKTIIITYPKAVK
jgi:hypothetical protein